MHNAKELANKFVESTVMCALGYEENLMFCVVFCLILQFCLLGPSVNPQNSDLTKNIMVNFGHVNLVTSALVWVILRLGSEV